MLRLLTVTALTVMTSGCMIGAAMLVPAGSGVTGTQPPNGQAASVNTINSLPSTPSADRPSGSPTAAPPVAPTVSPTLPPTVASRSAQLIIGRWQVDGSNPIVAIELRADRSLTALLIDGTTRLGTYTTTDSTVTLQFPGESAFTHPLSFRDNDNTMTLGTIVYRRF